MWSEAAVSAFVVAPTLPSMVDASRVAELFQLLEQGELQISDLQIPDVTLIRNPVRLIIPLFFTKIFQRFETPGDFLMEKFFISIFVFIVWLQKFWFFLKFPLILKISELFFFSSATKV